MIAAPVGTQVDGFTVAPACGEAGGRYALCLTHGLTFPDQGALAAHSRERRRSATPCFRAELCVVHGPEAARTR
jgi:hypothetical protein